MFSSRAASWPQSGGASRARPCSTPAGASSYRASSTCTRTCASPATKRLRRSKPAPAPPRSAASPPSSPCPTRNRRSTTLPSWRPCSPPAVRPPARSRRRAASPRAGAVTSSRRWGRCTPSACGSSPTTARASPTLAAGGHMHEGSWSSRLGIPGRPEAAEATVVARDVLLAELTGTPVHFLHLSTAAAVDLVRDAKGRGVPVTAEVAPHHFTLTDAECRTFDPAFKVHPPLRTDADVAAVKTGLAEGTIDAIATDHAPHVPEAKERPFEEAPPPRGGGGPPGAGSPAGPGTRPTPAASSPVGSVTRSCGASRWSSTASR